MADVRNNKSTASNTRTRQPFLTELYPGVTPLPNEPQFKDPARVRKTMQERGVPFINEVRYSDRFTGSPNDRPVTATIYVGKNSGADIIANSTKPFQLTGIPGIGIQTVAPGPYRKNKSDSGRPIQLSGNIAPYYPASTEIWRRVTGNNVPTNKEIVNLQAGDSGYFDKAVQHYTNIPDADYTRAGLWRFPTDQMLEYGNRTAIIPKIKQASQSNAQWNPANGGSIEVFKQKETSPQSSIVENNDVAVNSNVEMGTHYGHEFNHSMSMPANSPASYEVEADHARNFNIAPDSEHLYWTVAPSGGFVSPAYSVTVNNEPDKYANAYGAVDTRRKDSRTQIKPPAHVSKVPAVGTASDYAGYAVPGATPANPVFRRAPVLYKGEKYTDGSDVDDYPYAYNNNEMTQGLISLNRAQHLLQQNIKKNPQAYIDAGIDPSALGQFMLMPTFLKSPAQLDQRMEFYHNHPEFSALLGQEPSRIIPRYFMLERERRNPDQSQEWRDYHQDLFNFTRANYFMARNGNNQNPMDTGMGKLYNNLA